jgi:hypothetical protein
VAATYESPDLFTGFLIAKDRVSVPVGIELFDWHRITSDVLVAENLIGIDVCYRWTSLYEIKFGPLWAWDLEQQKEVLGFSFLLLKF